MEKRSLSLFTVVLLALLINLTFVSAITGSIGNSRMILRPEVDGWSYTSIEKYILVKNVNDVPIDIELKLDETAQEFIELVDEKFSLEPGQDYKAKFLVQVKKVGDYSGKIQVFFTPQDGEGAGVVLSSAIIVIPEKESGYDPEEDEEVIPEEDKEDSGVSVGLSGKVIDNSSSFKFNPFYLSTFVLAIVFVALLFLINKRGKTSDKKNIKKKSNKKK